MKTGSGQAASLEVIATTVDAEFVPSVCHNADAQEQRMAACRAAMDNQDRGKSVGHVSTAAESAGYACFEVADGRFHPGSRWL